MSSQILKWLSSTGGLFEWLRPAAFALSALASAWVLRDALHLRLKPPACASWALITLVIPHVALPAYLAARILSRRWAPKPEKLTDPPEESGAALRAEVQPRAEADVVDGATADGDPSATQASGAAPAAPKTRARALPPLYALALLALGALYFYSDYRSVDARLARAAEAKVRARYALAAREYRAALRAEDDPHTRKLLGLALADAGRWDEALAELRAAERDGQADEKLPLHLARALDALGRRHEANAERRKFLAGESCSRPDPDPLCESARALLPAAGWPAP